MIAIGKKSPAKYSTELLKQCNGGRSKYGGIRDPEQLAANLRMHCIPSGMENADIDSYDEFLEKRRVLMASKMRDYYGRL